MHHLGRHSPRLKELRRRVRDRRPGEVVVDGRRLVAELVNRQRSVRELYIARSAEDHDATPALVAAAAQVWVVEDSVLARVCPTHHPQGLLAIVDEPSPPPWAGCDSVALYLDRVQDPGNVGAIVRAAAALGAASVLLSPGCADPLHWASVRGSAGAVFAIPVVPNAALSSVTELVRGHGGQVWATAPSGVRVSAWRPAEPTLLLLGSEGAGLDCQAAAAADGTVWVHLERDVESLNVAVAAAVLLHAFAMRGTRA